MNFDQGVYQFISTQGVNITYKKISLGSYDPNTLSGTETVTNYTIKSYPKQLRASNYYLPNLIGKEVIMFYIRATGLGFTIDLKDKITYGSKTYLVDSYSEHVGDGSILMYRVIGVKA